MKWGSWLNFFVGIWLLFAPWALHLSGVPLGNSIIFGILAIIVAAWSLATPVENHAPAWLNLIFGIWMFVSPWALGFTAGAALWNGVIVGVLMVLFAIARMMGTRITAGPTV
jgi:hypothetical protein